MNSVTAVEITQHIDHLLIMILEFEPNTVGFENARQE